MATGLFGPILHRVQECVDAALTAGGVPVGRSQVIPGQQSAADNCCEGQLSVRLDQVYPTAGTRASFPQQDVDPSCAPTMLAARIGVEVLRCAHVVTEGGIIPTAAEVTADADAMTTDSSLVFTALMCCLPNMPGVNRWVIDRWVPKPVQGGCMGGEWMIVVAVGHCGCA